MVAPLLILGVVALGALAFGSKANASAGRKRSVLVDENGEVFPVVDTELAALSRAGTGAAETPMPESLQVAMANSMKLLTVDNAGNIMGPVTVDAVRTATQIAGRLAAEGFPEAAATLRGLSNKAIPFVSPPKVEDEIPLPSTLDPEMQARVQMMIQNERDPAILQLLVDGLMQTPKNAERDLAVQTLRALILQIETANIARESLEKAQAVMVAPTGALDPAPTPTPVVFVDPPARVVPVPPPEVIAPPAPVVVPAAPPEPAPKTPMQQAGEGMALHLKNVQSRFGVRGSKGREDKAIVRRFQEMAGLSADGAAGPGTLAMAARTGTGGLPRVMYWPRGSNRLSVQVYRDKLREFADGAEAQGFVAIANELRMSANMETGESGIIQTGPALT